MIVERVDLYRFVLFAVPVLLLVHVAGVTQEQKQGLRLFLSSDSVDSTDVRRARTVSLYVPEDKPVSPFLPAGPFSATWKGALTYGDFGMDVTISARGRGTLHVTVNGETALDGKLQGRTRVSGEAVGVQNGKNPLEVTYTSPPDGPAWIRLYWESEDFYPEPLPVDQLVYSRTDRMKKQTFLRNGRNLFMEHRCVQCHQSETGFDRKWTSPGIAKDAPDLSAAGTMFRTEWIAEWVADPHSHRSDASMPAVLHGSKQRVERKAQAIAAYLSRRTDASAAGSEIQISDRQKKQGRRLFRRFGCMGCHTLSGKEKQGSSKPSFDRLSLSYVADKWKPGALATYLMNPRDHYRWNPMPDFRLNEKKAKALASYLIQETGHGEETEPVKVTEERVKRGKRLTVRCGCQTCHTGTGTEEHGDQSFEAPSLQSIMSSTQTAAAGEGTGCLAGETGTHGKAPNFEFDDRERKALRTFLRSERADSLSRSVPAEFAARQMERLRCNACHRRDGSSSVWSRLPDEQTEVSLDQEKTHGVKQLRPPLTWAGDMLQFNWLKDTVTGSLQQKTRPWLAARMPGFGPYGPGLARGMAAQHGYPPERISYASDSLERARKGKQIVSDLNCYSCHGAGDREPNTFEVAGINFFKSGERLHRQFAIRWTLAPGRVRSDTGMPAFFQWGKPSPLPGILNGDLRKQMDGVWQYLRHAEELETR